MFQYVMRKDRLFVRVAIGFALGIILGLALPQFSKDTKIIGDIFMTLIRMMIVPVLFCAVAGGIANIQDPGTLRRVGLKTVCLYVVMFMVSAVLSFGVAFMIRPGRGVVFENAPAWTGTLADTSVTGFLSNLFPPNIFAAFVSGNIIQIIIFTAFFAVAIVACGKKAQPMLDWINSLSEVVFKVLGYVMEFSPFGVMSLMAFSLAEYGLGLFTALGKYIICCYVACVVVFVVVMALPVVLMGMKPGHLLRGLSKIAMMTASTTSSAATLPTTIQVNIEDFGAPEGISKFTLPLGCTINMCGGACSFCCLAVFVADFYGLNLSLSTMAGMVVVATLINMAAPGIPGGGIVLGASFLATFGLPFDLMGPIAAFYRLLDMAFTTMNVVGDVTANLLIAKSEKQWDAGMVAYHKIDAAKAGS